MQVDYIAFILLLASLHPFFFSLLFSYEKPRINDLTPRQQHSLFEIPIFSSFVPMIEKRDWRLQEETCIPGPWSTSVLRFLSVERTKP